MTFKEAEKIVLEYEKWQDRGCTCHIGNPPCAYCECCPSEDMYNEAYKILLGEDSTMEQFNMEWVLVQDNSYHWYVIPLDFKKAWNQWCELAEEDEKSWTVPEYARPVGGSPSLVKFRDFVIGD